MNIVAELVDLCRKALFLLTSFGVLMGVLGFLRWASESAGFTKKAKRMKQGGQLLGRASGADLKAIRTSRFSNNRFQMQATMAKEAKRRLRLSKAVVSSSSSSSAIATRKPRPSGILSGGRSTSPRSVAGVPDVTSTLPEELRSESTKHFFVIGTTKFIALPTLANLDDAMAILRRLSEEFMPIIRKRGFNIRSVSEMCCCGDGLEYELGGEKRSVPAGETIVGNDHDSVAGYNGKLIDRFGRPEHVIHLRLRKVNNDHQHNEFMQYEEIIDTMAHELAHCVYEDHGPEFWLLMEEILQDRTKIVEDLMKNGTGGAAHDPSAASKEQFQGFDIYRSLTGQLRNWNGQVRSS